MLISSMKWVFFIVFRWFSLEEDRRMLSVHAYCLNIFFTYCKNATVVL